MEQDQKPPRLLRLSRSLKLGILLGTAAGVLIVGLGTLAYFYVHFAHLIDAKLTAGPFQSTAMIFAAPRSISVGDQSSPAEIVYQLRRSGYTEAQDNRMGWYHLRADAVEIYPGVDSYFLREPAVLKFAGGRVSEVFSLSDHTERTQYLLEPELITNLFDRNREKRRLVKYKDIPRVMIEAVVSGEDKRFFQHSGFDPLRIVKAVYVDLREHRKEQGASTLEHAARAQPVARSEEDLATESRRSADDAPPGAEALQGADLRGLRQRSLPGPPRQLQHPGLRRRRPGLFRQEHPAAYPAGGRHAGRPDPAARRLQPVPLSRTALAPAAT